MTTRELARIVLDMRDAQRRYFQTHKLEDLTMSKCREREVDAVVKSVLDERPKLLTGMED
jgi:hypothetical protein